MNNIRIVSGTEDLISEAANEYQVSIDIFNRNNDTYLFAVDDSNKVVGFLSFFPIEDRMFSNLRSGEILGSSVRADNILEYVDGGRYSGYLSSIAVHPDFRQQGVAVELFKSWYELLYKLAIERDIYFDLILSDAVSPAGLRLLDKVGFRLHMLSEHNSILMMLDLRKTFCFRPEFNAHLFEVYLRRHNESVFSSRFSAS